MAGALAAGRLGGWPTIMLACVREGASSTGRAAMIRATAYIVLLFMFVGRGGATAGRLLTHFQS